MNTDKIAKSALIIEKKKRELEIKLKSLILEECSLKIYDYRGNLIDHFEHLNSEKIKVEIKNYNIGFYIVTLEKKQDIFYGSFYLN